MSLDLRIGGPDGMPVGEVFLREDGYWYLGTPYSRYPEGLAAAFRSAAKVAALIARVGATVYSPIVHGHSLALYGALDPLDHELWMRIDRPMMDGAHGLVVACMPSWRESRGLEHEIERFRARGAPVVYLDPPRGCLVSRCAGEAG
ncbi:MAG: DUF1937 family protein [Alphaproteobacteria bacterium]